MDIQLAAQSLHDVFWEVMKDPWIQEHSPEDQHYYAMSLINQALNISKIPIDIYLRDLESRIFNPTASLFHSKTSESYRSALLCVNGWWIEPVSGKAFELESEAWKQSQKNAHLEWVKKYPEDHTIETEFFHRTYKMSFDLDQKLKNSMADRLVRSLWPQRDHLFPILSALPLNPPNPYDPLISQKDHLEAGPIKLSSIYQDIPYNAKGAFVYALSKELTSKGIINQSYVRQSVLPKEGYWESFSMCGIALESGTQLIAVTLTAPTLYNQAGALDVLKDPEKLLVLSFNQTILDPMYGSTNTFQEMISRTLSEIEQHILALENTTRLPSQPKRRF